MFYILIDFLMDFLKEWCVKSEQKKFRNNFFLKKILENKKIEYVKNLSSRELEDDTMFFGLNFLKKDAIHCYDYEIEYKNCLYVEFEKEAMKKLAFLYLDAKVSRFDRMLSLHANIYPYIKKEIEELEEKIKLNVDKRLDFEKMISLFKKKKKNQLVIFNIDKLLLFSRFSCFLNFPMSGIIELKIDYGNECFLLRFHKISRKHFYLKSVIASKKSYLGLSDFSDFSLIRAIEIAPPNIYKGKYFFDSDVFDINSVVHNNSLSYNDGIILFSVGNSFFRSHLENRYNKKSDDKIVFKSIPLIVSLLNLKIDVKLKELLVSDIEKAAVKEAYKDNLESLFSLLVEIEDSEYIYEILKLNNQNIEKAEKDSKILEEKIDYFVHLASGKKTCFD
jgi:hypothetical protein